MKAGEDAMGNMLSVSMKTSDGKILSTTLKGHKNEIVDIEFLRSGDFGKVYTLGSCDKDGVVYLWFLKREIGGGEVGIGKEEEVEVGEEKGMDEKLVLLRYYSFYSLRKSRFAYFSRIRLAGTVDKGTMVLCPNDGSDVRVIQFCCVARKDGGEGEDVPVIKAAPSSMDVVEGDEGMRDVGERDVGIRDDDDGYGFGKKEAMVGGGLVGGAAGLGAGALSRGRDGDSEGEYEEEYEEEVEEEVEEVEDAESVDEDGEERREYVRDEDNVDNVGVIESENVAGTERLVRDETVRSQGMEPHTEPLPGTTGMMMGGVGGSGNPSRVDTGVSEGTGYTDLEPEKNKTYPLSQEEFGDVEVDDDIAAATAQAAGIDQEGDEVARDEAVEGEYEGEGAEDAEGDQDVEYGDDDDEYKDAKGSDSEYEDEYEDQVAAGDTGGMPIQSHTA